LEPDIFLSYAREDERRAGELAATLKQEGYTVFWDRQIPIGQTWHSFIGEALRSAKCVVVAWSEHSIKSDWVIEEANYGKNRRILMPVLLDIAEPPLGFGSIQAADFRDWKPGRRPQAFNDLLSGIARITVPPSTAPPGPKPGADIRPPEERGLLTQSYGRSRSWLLGGIALLAILTGGAGYWWFQISEPPVDPDLSRLETEARTPQPQGRLAEESMEEATPSPGAATPDAPSSEEFRDCEDCPLMVALSAGSFTMGSTGGEDAPHPVTVSAFAIGKYEVTFKDWDVCVADGGCNGYKPNDRGWGRGPRPVINVSWDEAKAYVEWLSRTTGKAYRLPSEAEWEYAARAGTSTAFALPAPDGSDDIAGKHLANCARCGSEWDNRETAPVGSFAANRFGLHDTAGNVWEWVEDCWNESYSGAPNDGSAWTSGDCGRRVLRGGSWVDLPEDLRSAFRNWFSTDDRLYYAGFRVATTLTRSESVTP
jgi:formylglycine-generating enzyme required for sulfatase activity